MLTSNVISDSSTSHDEQKQNVISYRKKEGDILKV